MYISPSVFSKAMSTVKKVPTLLPHGNQSVPLFSFLKSEPTIIQKTTNTVTSTIPKPFTPKWKTEGFKVPPSSTQHEFSPEGLEATKRLIQEHRIPHNQPIPDTFLSQGLGMQLSKGGQISKSIGCEVIQIDLKSDKTLINTIDGFKAILAQNPDISETHKARLLLKYIDDVFSVSKDDAKLCSLAKQLPSGEKIKLGDIIDSGAGVCRHRSLLAKIIGDKVGLGIDLLEGNYGKNIGRHMWNEFTTKDGKKYLFEPMGRFMVELSNETYLDMRAISYFSRGLDTSYYKQNSMLQKLFEGVKNLKNNQSLNLGNKAIITKADGSITIKALEGNSILINGKKSIASNHKLQGGDTIEYVTNEGKFIKIVWSNTPFDL